jgi:CelD/BcsL family acetyltransferase involved in cellulose biosynthesis
MRCPPASDRRLSTRKIHAQDLTDQIRADWRALTRQHPDYDSALLQPEFTETVASVRDDVRIVLFESGSRLIGVWPIHLRPGRYARPVGTPFADYGGPVLDKDAGHDLQALMELSGIAGFKTHGLIDPWQQFQRASMFDDDDAQSAETHVIRPAGRNGDALYELQRAAHPKRLKNMRRQQNQFEREHGPLSLTWGPPVPGALDTLYDFKSRQFSQSGLVNMITATEPRRLLDAVASGPYAFMTTLWCGDRLISGHFGFRAGNSFHPWIAAFDPEFSDYSPGNLLLLQILKKMPETGLTAYDLAEGHDHYKKYFCNEGRSSSTAFSTSAGTVGRRYRFTDRLWRALGSTRPDSAAGRLRRRMDQFAVSELALPARAYGFAYAVLARPFLRRKRI